MLRRGGTYVEAGHYTDHGDVALNPFRHMVHKQITLVAVWGADTPHFVAGRALIESGKYPFADLVSHRLPLDRVADGSRRHRRHLPARRRGDPQGGRRRA